MKLPRLLRENLPVQITFANLSGFFLTFLSIPLIARSIGPAGRGETAAALAAFAIAPTILALGIPLELRRRSTARLDAQAIRAFRDLIVLATVPALAIGVVFVSTIYSDADLTLRLLALVGLTIFVPLTVSWSGDIGALIGQGRYRAVALIKVVHPAVTLMAIFFAALTGNLTLPVVLVANLLATGATAVLAFSLTRVSIRGKRASRKKLARSGTRFAGSAIAESASSRLDQVVVLPLIGATAAGYYSIAASVALLPLALGHALAADHFRAVAASSSPRESGELCRRAIRESISVALPFCVAFTAIAALALPVVFGSEFRNAVPVLIALAPGSACLVVGYVASMLLAAQGRGKTMSIIQVSGLATGMVLLVVLGPFWSAVGAGIASSLSYVAVLVAQLSVLNVKLSDLLPRFAASRDGVRSLWPARD